MARLHVLREGRGPTLLMLHGIGASATAWGRQIERLGSDYTCIAPDLPGYGDSPDPSAPGLDAIAAAVIGVLDGRPAHVIGVSFGALTALALARSWPRMVTSLVLADATLGKAAAPDAERQRWLQHRQALSVELATRSVERAAEIAGPGAGPEIVQEIARHMRRARPAGYMAVARAIAETDARPWLGSIDQRALVIHGEQDRVTGADVSQALLQALPHADATVIPGAGHAPHIERPDHFAAAVRRFLAGAQQLSNDAAHHAPLPARPD